MQHQKLTDKEIEKIAKNVENYKINQERNIIKAQREAKRNANRAEKLAMQHAKEAEIRKKEALRAHESEGLRHAKRELNGRTKKRYANNTYLEEDPQTGNMGMTYHATEVAHFDNEGVTIRSGGYGTSTTKERINRALGEIGNTGKFIIQRDYVWYVADHNGENPWENYKSLPKFESGMKIPYKH